MRALCVGTFSHAFLPYSTICICLAWLVHPVMRASHLGTLSAAHGGIGPLNTVIAGQHVMAINISDKVVGTGAPHHAA